MHPNFLQVSNFSPAMLFELRVERFWKPVNESIASCEQQRINV